MKNKLTDLNDHLFAQLERLGDEGLTKEQAELEIKRSNAVTSVAREVISNASLVLKAEIAFRDVAQKATKVYCLAIRHWKASYEQVFG